LTLAVFNQLLLKLIFQRDSFWRAVGRHWRHSHREKLSSDEESSSPTSTEGFRLSSESADQTRHWHCVRAVEQTFIVVLAAAIYTTVAAVICATVGFAVLPSLNAPLLVFALLFVTLPFSPVLLGVADPLVIPRLVAVVLLLYLCQLYCIIVIGCFDCIII